MGYKVKKIYIYQNGQEKQVRPATWKPDASRTLLYLPLQNDILDYSGNNKNGTLNGSISYVTGGCRLTNGNYIKFPKPATDTILQVSTMSAVIKINSIAKTGNWSYRSPIGMYNEYSGSQAYHFTHKTSGDSDYSSNKILFRFATSNFGVGMTVAESRYFQTRNHIVGVVDNNICSFYLNGNLIESKSFSGSISTSNDWFINYATNMWGTDLCVGRLIIEKIAWGQSDVTKYLDSIKSIYGIS